MSHICQEMQVYFEGQPSSSLLYKVSFAVENTCGSQQHLFVCYFSLVNCGTMKLWVIHPFTKSHGELHISLFGGSPSDLPKTSIAPVAACRLIPKLPAC